MSVNENFRTQEKKKNKSKLSQQKCLHYVTPVKIILLHKMSFIDI